MTLRVALGRGYQPASQRKANAEGGKGAIGALHLDASFSPVRRVAYTVESTRGRTTYRLRQIDYRSGNQWHRES